MPDERPDQHIIELIDRAAYLRGRYITSYAHCEFLLADLSVKIDNRFRYALDKRINAAKAMAASSGPLNVYADEFIPLIENFVDWSERRHWFAHGLMTLTTDPLGNHLFKIRRYEKRGDGELYLLTWEATIQAIQESVDAINRFCQAFMSLCRRIYLELGVEQVQPR